MKTRILAFCLALAACFCLTGCGVQENVVMTYGESVITENVFRYYLSYYKNIYLKTYTDMKDSADYYKTVLPDGRTAEEYLLSYDLTGIE